MLIKHVFDRDVLNDSIKLATTTSKIEITEVIAAIETIPKKKNETIFPKTPKELNTIGMDENSKTINEYRAKLFSKAHSSEARINLTNEILDIPKKVTQAFGRTTYTFYFKKDAIDRTNANNNINNFGYDGPKKPYKFKISKRSDTGSYK